MTALDAVKESGITALDVARAFGLRIEQSGRAKCPWHSGGNERHPALSFKGKSCRCFACGEGGDAITLAGQLLGCEAKPAAEAICRELGIAFDGVPDAEAEERRARTKQQREEKAHAREEQTQRHTILCKIIRDASAALEAWTPEHMELQPEAFWRLVEARAMAEQEIELMVWD